MYALKYSQITYLACRILVVLACFFCVHSAALAADEKKYEGGEGSVEFSTIGGVFYNSLTSIGGTVMALSGRLLDVTLSWFVFGMADTMIWFNLLNVVSDIWKLIRDLFNLIFIFGLIFIGFKIILDINDSQSKRSLGYLLVAALLINFSLYVTEVIIDFSNVAAAEIGAQFETPARATVFGLEIKNISSGFIAATSLENLKDNSISVANELQTGKYELITSVPLGIGTAISMGLAMAFLMIVIGIVFAYGSVIMFARFIYLIFLMMFSPVMFLGWVLPNFNNLTKDWWGKLFSNAFVGPAYLFMLFIALRALESMVARTAGDGGGLTGLMVSTLFTAAFAWGALRIAQKMGAFGTSMVMSSANKLRNGISGYALSRTAGKWADNANKRLEAQGVAETSTRRRLLNNLAGQKFGGSFSGQQLNTAADKADAKRSRYDQLHGKREGRWEGLKEGRIIPRRQGGALNTIRTGAAADATQSAQADASKAVAKLSNDQVIEVLGTNKANTPEFLQVVKSMTNKQYEAVMKSDKFDDARRAEIEKARQEAIQTTIAEQEKKKPASGVGSLTKAELAALGTTQIVLQAGNLKQSQFDDIMKGDEFNGAEKDEIKTARIAQLQSRFAQDPAAFFAPIGDADAVKLPKNEILLKPEAAPYITGQMLKHILSDKVMTPAERKTLRNNIKTDGVDQVKKWFNTSEGRLF